MKPNWERLLLEMKWCWKQDLASLNVKSCGVHGAEHFPALAANTCSRVPQDPASIIFVFLFMYVGTRAHEYEDYRMRKTTTTTTTTKAEVSNTKLRGHQSSNGMELDGMNEWVRQAVNTRLIPSESNNDDESSSRMQRSLYSVVLWNIGEAENGLKPVASDCD